MRWFPAYPQEHHVLKIKNEDEKESSLHKIVDKGGWPNSKGRAWNHTVKKHHHSYIPLIFECKPFVD